MSNSISQNSQYFSIVPQNGTTFTAGNKIIFEINPNIAFVKGKDSYLAFDIFNSSQNKEIVAFPNTAGASSVIDRMDIYSLNNGTLLESLTNANQWAGIENQYAYDVKEQLVAKEGISEECYSYNVDQNQTNGVTAHVANPRLADKLGDMLLSQTQGVDAVYMAKRFIIPLRSGIFNWWGDSEKLTPIVLYSGLRIEITLADNNKVCQSVYGKSDIAHVNNVDNGIAVANVAAPGAPAVNYTLVSNTNYASSLNVCGLVKGNRIQLSGTIDGGAGNRNGTITDLTIAANKLNIAVTFDSNVSNFQGAVCKLLVDSSYTVKKAEMKLLQVLPTKEMMKAAVKESQIPFLSYDVFLDTLPSTSLSHQSEINSVANRAKSVFTVMTNASKETDPVEKFYYTGLAPNLEAGDRTSGCNSVQYFINNKLFPTKDYNPQRKYDKVQAHNEVIKAWSSINKPCKNLGDSKGTNMADYTNTFLIARELARENMVYPLKNSEAELRMRFDTTRTFNSRIYNYVFSEKVINVSQDGLSVIL